MVYRLQEGLKQPRKLLLSGFGVGMSWASCVMETSNIHICDIVELEESNYTLE
jgi:3-oxoacyl-[acyl-carrier-protein] synthase-3